jgi:hypothetical protein
MGMPIKKKTYDIKSRIGDSLEVSVEKVGARACNRRDC